MAKESANIDGYRKPQPPSVPSAGNGPDADDCNFWMPSNDPKDSTIAEIEKGFGRK